MSQASIAPVRELLAVNAPVAIAVEEGGDLESVTVKGFASVEMKDRSGDVVPPEEFDISKFMVNPQLLVNHKFWIDMMGNGVAVGRPNAVHAAKLVKIDGNDKEWGVKDLKTRELVNTYPKAKIPDLKAGDRGLFIVAEVTIPEVAKMVRSGELATFSWRGLVNVDFELGDDGTVHRVFKDIDLFEISLTHIPDNPSSTFVIGKTVDGEVIETEPNGSMAVHLVRLSKGRFESDGVALEYLKAHGLRCDAVREDDGSYFAMQNANVDVSKLISVKMSEGVNMVVGPLDVDKKPGSSWLGEMLGKEAAELLTKGLPIEMDSKEKGEPDMATEDAKTEAEKKEADAKAQHPGGCPDGMHMVAGNCVPVKTADAKKEADGNDEAQEALKALGAAVATQTAEALKPTFEKQAESMAQIGTALAGMTEAITKMAGGGVEQTDTNTDSETDKTKEEAAKTADPLAAVFDQLNTMANSLKETQTAVVEVAKTAQALSKSTPSPTVRDEKIDAAKSAEEDDDPNACLDSIMPFLG